MSASGSEPTPTETRLTEPEDIARALFARPNEVTLASLLAAVASLRKERDEWKMTAQVASDGYDFLAAELAAREVVIEAVTLERDDADTLLVAVGLHRKPNHDLAARSTPESTDTETETRSEY